MPRNILPTPPEVTHRGATIRKYTGGKPCYMCSFDRNKGATWQCTVKTGTGPAHQWLCDVHAASWKRETSAKEVSDG